jgi:hypothetical protein
MANKEKESDNRSTKITTPVVKELNKEVLEGQFKEKAEYHNKLATERERLLGEVNKVTEAMTHARGEVTNLQNLINVYFDSDAPSDNGTS